jgi:hypothetical protein
VLLDFGNQWISSLIEFWGYFSQALMVKSLRNQWELEESNGGERESLPSVARGLEVGERSSRPLGRLRWSINTHPLESNGLMSAALPHLKCGTAALAKLLGMSPDFAGWFG